MNILIPKFEEIFLCFNIYVYLWMIKYRLFIAKISDCLYRLIMEGNSSNKYEPMVDEA